MSTEGKYVRAPDFDPEEFDDVSLVDESGSDDLTELHNDTERHDSEGRSSASVARLSDDEDMARETNGVEDPTASKPDDIAEKDTTTENHTKRSDNQDLYHIMKQFGETLNRLVKALDSKRRPEETIVNLHEDDRSWTSTNANVGASTSIGNFRWENIQPFPENVPANRMWEQWVRFFDRFEIAISLSNINDQVKRAQILFLAMGEKLQGIILAAKLRPSLADPNCYDMFVKNIEAYLRSMVDVTAEHEAFTYMMQGPSEPTITFHARLMEKIRLCGYSSVDQDRFIRTQLLKGMRNKELVRTARTFGYDTLFIVQSATREEAYTAEIAQPETSQALAVTHNHKRDSGEIQRWKRKRDETADGYSNGNNERKNRGLGRRSRCPRCNRLFHKFGSCPAINSSCNNCGVRGHFSIVCRKKTASHLEVEQKHSPKQTRDENERKVNLREIEY